jgi:hypothetical protein
VQPDLSLSALADPASWAAIAGRLLASLGFILVQGDRPGRPGGANLLVGLRDRPTLAHFDPEDVSYWAAISGRGRLAAITRGTPVPWSTTVSWGSVRVVDRLAEENRFLTFGGELRAEALDGTLTVVGLHSPGPIVRWSGHSQGTDPLAGEVGAFFARLMVPVDFVTGAEQRLAATPAAVLYATFLDDTHRRLVRETSFGTADDELVQWVSAELARVREGSPAAWEAGVALRAALSLDHPGAA